MEEQDLDGRDYVLRRFGVALKDAEGWDAVLAWYRAVGAGFYDKAREESFVGSLAEMGAIDRREFTGVYQHGPVPAGTPGEEVPVATFATLRKTLNAGYGRLVPAHLVTSVTVRTSHRRRGILRRMMSADLARAKADGVPVAALTASEGSIYRRFGFGVATTERVITVDAGRRFQLTAAPAGRVEVAEPKALLEIGPRIFVRVHQSTPGSIDRQESYRRAAGGQFDRDTGGPDPNLRAALHFAPDGTPDGYVTYSFKGWDRNPPSVEVHDLVAATHSAYLGLWEFLGSLDLIERVVWKEAPVDDPLPWALTDPRCVAADAARDALWLRILDVEAALSARRYGSDDEMVLGVTDPMGLASGMFRLSVTGGEPTVERLDEGGAEADVTMDVAELSSLFCGGVHTATLAAAGLLGTAAARPEATLRLGRLFSVERPAHCLTHF